MLKAIRIPDDEKSEWKEFTKHAAYHNQSVWEALQPLLKRYVERSKNKINKQTQQ